MKALMVIDMLRDFIDKDGALYIGRQGEEIIPYVNKKINEYRSNNFPIIFICDNHEKDDKEFDMFNPHCIAGSWGSQIIDQIDVADEDKVIYKRRYSVFFGTDLDIFLREKSIDEISIVGVCTNICVLYTAADARNLGYKVNIYKDGVASFDRTVHDFALKEAQNTLGCSIL
ncbi:MAG: cysteine hydrolase [Thermoanaerobacterales bacterium]|nr:cysteine hydrolase [Thermoanaerobacterales bacterium]